MSLDEISLKEKETFPIEKLFDEMENLIIQKVLSLELEYKKIETSEEMKKIYNLWIENIHEEPTTYIECGYFGSYYRFIKENIELATKYYLTSVEINTTFLTTLCYFCLSKDIVHKIVLDKASIIVKILFYQELRYLLDNDDEKLLEYLDKEEPKIRGTIYAVIGNKLITNKDEKCLIYLNKGVELENTDCMNNLGIWYRDIDNALSYSWLKRAIKLDGNVFGELNFGAFNCKDGNYRKAIKHLERIVDKDIELSLHWLGVSYLGIKDFNMAKKYLKISLKNIPGSYFYLADTYNGIGKTTKCLFYLSQSKDNTHALLFINKILEKIFIEKIPLDEYFFKSFPFLKDKKDQLSPMVSLLITLYNKEIDVLHDAFMFAPGEEGYQQALTSYNSLLSQKISS